MTHSHLLPCMTHSSAGEPCSCCQSCPSSPPAIDAEPPACQLLCWVRQVQRGYVQLLAGKGLQWEAALQALQSAISTLSHFHAALAGMPGAAPPQRSSSWFDDLLDEVGWQRLLGSLGWFHKHVGIALRSGPCRCLGQSIRAGPACSQATSCSCWHQQSWMCMAARHLGCS